VSKATDLDLAPRLNIDSFLSEAQDSKAEEELYEDVANSRKLIDEVQTRRQSDWSILSNQIVGSEKIESN